MARIQTMRAAVPIICEKYWLVHESQWGPNQHFHCMDKQHWDILKNIFNECYILLSYLIKEAIEQSKVFRRVRSKDSSRSIFPYNNQRTVPIVPNCICKTSSEHKVGIALLDLQKLPFHNHSFINWVSFLASTDWPMDVDYWKPKWSPKTHQYTSQILFLSQEKPPESGPGSTREISSRALSPTDKGKRSQ